jgi:hypothetical protein
LDHEEAGLAEAERMGWKICGGDPSTGWIAGVIGVRDERLAVAAEVGGDGWGAAVFDGETEVDGGGALSEALLADGLEELGAVAEEKL